MSQKKILDLAAKNNGVITFAMVVDSGYSRTNLKRLVNSGKLNKSSRGVYVLPSYWDDEILNLQLKFKRGIFSHETSLFLLNYTDQTPHNFHMTFPSTYNITKVKENNVNCTQVLLKFYNIGIIKANTPYGNEVFTYNIERTLCDILRKNSNVDIQLITQAFKMYANSNTKNIPLISEYSKILKVEKKLGNYLEVLL